VHKERTSCPLFQSHQHRTAPEGEIVCDCAVDELLELLLSEIDEISFKDKKSIKHRHMDLMSNMPRHILVDYKKEMNPPVEISWEVLVSEHFGTDFEVFLFSENDWDTAKENHLYYETAPVENEDDLEAESETDVESDGPRSSSARRASTHLSRSPSNKSSNTNYVWQGKTKNYARNIQLPSSITPDHYFATIRSVQRTGALYSLPVRVNIPCPCPQNITAEREEGRITVKWTFPELAAKFKVTCTSIYDTIHTSPMVSGTRYEFEVERGQNSDLEIQIMAISNGIQSAERVVSVNTKKSTLPDPDGRAREPASEGIISPSTSPAPFSETPLRPHRSPRHRSPLWEEGGGFESESDGETVNDEFDDNASYAEENDEVLLSLTSPGASSHQHSGKNDSSRPQMDTRSAGVQFDSSQLSNTTFALSQDISQDEMLASSNVASTFSFTDGVTYQIRLDDGAKRIIYVHRQDQKSVVATSYIFESSLAGWFETDESGYQERLFMKYLDWDMAGEEDDAEELPKSRIIEVSQEVIKIRKPDDPVEMEAPEDTTVTYTVEWGIRIADKLHEVRSFYNVKDDISADPTDLANLAQGDVAYYLGFGIPSWSVGFQKAGYDISVAVIEDEMAAQMWRVLPPF